VWVKRIQASGAEEAWVYFNNDRNGHAVANALAMRRMLRTPAAQDLAAEAVKSGLDGLRR